MKTPTTKKIITNLLIFVTNYLLQKRTVHNLITKTIQQTAIVTLLWFLMENSKTLYNFIIILYTYLKYTRISYNIPRDFVIFGIITKEYIQTIKKTIIEIINFIDTNDLECAELRYSPNHYHKHKKNQQKPQQNTYIYIIGTIIFILIKNLKIKY